MPDCLSLARSTTERNPTDGPAPWRFVDTGKRLSGGIDWLRFRQAARAKRFGESGDVLAPAKMDEACQTPRGNRQGTSQAICLSRH